MKRLLTQEDLIKYFESNNISHFSSKESGHQICISIPVDFEQEDADDSTLLMGKVKLLHTGRNRNRSNVTEEAAKKCMKSISYQPILANFTDVNGELDFTSHDFIINKDGSVTYIEKQVGCFTADKPYMEEDPEHEGRKYVYARCAIPRHYTAAADIIERKGGTKISAELAVYDVSYDSREKEMVFNDISLLGATLLGVDPDTGREIGEGMEGARVDIEDFSVENNCSFSKNDLIEEITQVVMQRLDNHNDNQRKEECGLDKKEFEEQAEQETVTDIDAVDTVETEAAEESVDGTTEEVTPAVVNESGEGTAVEEGTVVEEQLEQLENVNESAVVENAAEDEAGINYSVKFNGEVKTFSVSLIEKLNALMELVNNTYGESDNTWYCVDAFDEEKIVLMHDIWNDKHYRQEYAVKKDVYSLKGDRVEVYCTYLTKDEQAKLESMKKDFAAVSEKLAKYESEPEKMVLLESADYAAISGMKEFAELKEQKNHFDLTIDEIKAKADGMLLQFAKSGMLTFAAATGEEKKPAQGMSVKKDFRMASNVSGGSTFLDELYKSIRR